MPSGLAALLDDISVIAKVAAASVDDIGLAATKAGTKAAGVVIDDAAVTPSYVTNFTPARELPIIWAIAKGSIKNKLLILLPAALLLSEFLPFAITPILMVGGLYLCFEGAEKLIEKFGGEKHGETLEDPIEDVAEFERLRIAGAIRTDMILSAEIIAIALGEIATSSFIDRALVLAAVSVGITALVYGAVAIIVKMDDVGLHLAEKPSRAAQSVGRMLLGAMPVVLAVLSQVGMLAMLWVGGGIILHGLEVLGWHTPAELAHGLAHGVEEGTGALGGVLGWLTYAAISAIVGLILGAIIAYGLHAFEKMRGGHVIPEQQPQ